MAFPWGDVSTAYYTTGIRNIEVFLAVPPALLWRARMGNLLGPPLGLAPVQAALKKRAGAITGPTAEVRAATPCYVWGEARNAAGTVRTARIRTANGYDVTVHGALAVVQFLLAVATAETGVLTPARLCGIGLAPQWKTDALLHRRNAASGSISTCTAALACPVNTTW